MSASYRWRASSEGLGPVRNAVVAGTAACDRQRYTCCAPRLRRPPGDTTAPAPGPGRGWNRTLSRYGAEFPEVMIQWRNALMSRALVALRCLTLTIAYS